MNGRAGQLLKWVIAAGFVCHSATAFVCSCEADDEPLLQVDTHAFSEVDRSGEECYGFKIPDELPPKEVEASVKQGSSGSIDAIPELNQGQMNCSDLTMPKGSKKENQPIPESVSAIQSTQSQE